MNIRRDYKIIAGMIGKESKVLDLGCGNGELMQFLSKEKEAQVQGIELNEDAIYECVEKGLSVFHSDIDTGLSGYPDKSFDYCILNQSLQEVKRIDFVIEESLRVASNVIVGFPNFAHIRSRFMLALGGRAPVTQSLPYRWYDTPNLRFLSIKDFHEFCREKSLEVVKERYLDGDNDVPFLPNLFALSAIISIKRKGVK